MISCDLSFFEDEKSELFSISEGVKSDELLLRGEVESYRLEIQKVGGMLNDGIVEKYPMIRKDVFNENSDKIEEVKYDIEGILIDKTIHDFVYDSHKNIIEKSSYDTIGNLLNNSTYIYNVDNNLVVCNNGNELIIYKYDDNGNKTEESGSHSYGHWWKFSYKYDQAGNLIEQIETSTFKPVTKGKWIYKYDGNDHPTKRTIYSTDGELSNIEIYEYNAEGQLTERRDEFSRYGANTRTKHIYKYDEIGNEIENFRYSLKGEIQYKNAYRYEYDSKNNWIKRVEIVNDVTVFISKREITYFND